MAEEPLTITEVYPGYRRRQQNFGEGCYSMGTNVIWCTLLGMSVLGFVVAEPYEHVALATLSTVFIWGRYINPLENLTSTTVAAVVIGFLLSLAWDSLPYVMTGVSLLVALFYWWTARLYPGED